MNNNEGADDEEREKDRIIVSRHTARAFGGYTGGLLWVSIVWIVFTLLTICWVHRTIRVPHDQLRTPSHVVNTFVSYRYWTLSWWALALPVLWRPWALMHMIGCIVAPRSSHARSRAMWTLKWCVILDILIGVYFILERYVMGCTLGMNPFLACHPDEWCDVHYKNNPATCSNDASLTTSPWHGLHSRYEWRYAIAFCFICAVLGLVAMWIIDRLGAYKYKPTVEEAKADVRDTLDTHKWFLLGLGIVTLLYICWATREVKFQHEWIRTPSTESTWFQPAFLSERYTLAWFAHVLGLVIQPMVVMTGTEMLIMRGLGPTGESHFLFLVLGVADAVIRLVYSTFALYTCNGNWWWSNTCHSSRICCLRFDEWTGNQCAGVGLLFGNETTPENDVWACFPPLISTQQLDRSPGFTAVFACTGFMLLWNVAMLYNWYRVKAWTRQARAIEFA